MSVYVASPLALRGLRNTRDLGGYPLKEGGTVRERGFLRSEAPAGLPEADLEALYKYGVRCVIDLRSEMEISMAASSFQAYREVDYHSVPLSDQVHDAAGRYPFPRSMGEMYIGLLDQAGEAFAEIFRVMLSHQADCVLFNCTAGKDRTGTVAMLLLKLAGVDDESVVADYAATEEYMPAWDLLQAQLSAKLGVEVPVHVFRSQPENMRAALAHLHRIYGGAGEFMRSIGLSDGEIALLRRKLNG